MLNAPILSKSKPATKPATLAVGPTSELGEANYLTIFKLDFLAASFHNRSGVAGREFLNLIVDGEAFVSDLHGDRGTISRSLTHTAEHVAGQAAPCFVGSSMSPVDVKRKVGLHFSKDKACHSFFSESVPCIATPDRPRNLKFPGPGDCKST
jgi:hypothetical protein